MILDIAPMDDFFNYFKEMMVIESENFVQERPQWIFEGNFPIYIPCVSLDMSWT